jgi:hypothetical protein
LFTPRRADEAERVDDGLMLQLRPYQRSALAFMCREEAAEGGVSRHFYARIPCGDSGGRGRG